MMSEERVSLKGLCLPYVLVLAFGVVAFRFLQLGPSVLLGDLLLFSSFVLLALGADAFGEKNSRRRFLFLLSSIVLYVSGTSCLWLNASGATLYESLQATLANSFPFLLVFPLFLRSSGKRGFAVSGALVGGFLVYLASKAYIYSYTYLYMDLQKVGKHGQSFHFLIILTFLIVLVELIFFRNRNYLGYCLLGTGFGGGIVEYLYRMNLEFSLKNVATSAASSWIPVSFLLFLIIYIRAERPETRVYKRRNVVFSNMVYQEVKPIKRKKKNPKFEVPPNVPKMKNEEEDSKKDEKC